MYSGRSRGRARTSSAQVPVPIQPGAEQPPTETTAQAPTLPAASPAIVPPPISQGPGRTASPQRIIPPAEPGRGRGIEPVTTTTTTTTQAQTQVGTVSPTGTSSGSPNESPPQQPSPPHPVQPVGRAALRGAVHQPGAPRSDLISSIERLALQETGETPAGEARRDFQYESVIHTKPLSCTTKIGIVGNPIKIFCNYFEVVSQANWVLYQYHVDFAPVIESRRLRRALLNVHAGLFQTNMAFDGSTLYTLTRLENELTELASTRNTDNQIITIKIKRISEICPTSPQFIHLFNVVFRRCLKLYGMKQIDRNYYDTKNRINIANYNLDLINGFSTAIANYEDKLLLCAELTHKLLHKQTILDLMYSIYDECRGNNDQFRERCTQELVGRIIMTKYNDKTYKIDDIDWDANPSANFEIKRRTPTGLVTENINFVDYYQANYQLTIKDMQQPLLVSQPSAKDIRRGQTKPIQLIPEFSIVTGVSDKMKEDFKFKKAVQQFSKVGPNDRCKRLSDFVARFNQNEKVKDELQKWRMNFNSRPMEIKGRVFPPEELGFGDSRIKKLTFKAEWGGDMKDVSLLQPIGLFNWILIYPASKSNTAGEFVKTYGGIIRSLGIRAEPPREISLPHDNAESIVNELKRNIKDGIQMVVVLVRSKRKDVYDAIKRICCIEMPVPSQVVTTAIIDDERKRRSVVTKVAIQMNCKLGGELWLTPIPLKNTMICGIDTYHDSQKKKSSVCAFIATTNKEYTKYFSRATIQETHQELSNNLTITVKSAIEFYKHSNGVYPDKLIIYRDGVSDGQLKLVIDYEVPQIQKAFEMVDKSYNPKLTLIVVKKRGNARFFANNQDGIGNPPCGTVIDNGVTRSEWFDFYLISQVVTQGTVNPTHYNVVYDTYGLDPDKYQRLSYKLTHMYYNWPGTIRVPATCQYAHKLAFLVGQSLHKEHHHSLCDKLFYL